VYQKANPAYTGFYNGGGSRHGDMAKGFGRLKSPNWVQGKAPVGVLGTKSPIEAEE